MKFSSKQINLIKSSLLFLAIFFTADRVAAYFIKKIYFSQKRGDFYQTTYALNNIHEDLVIFGSSRAMHHYVPEMFAKDLNLSTYNTGRNGRKLSYSYAVFSQILTYHKPKMVILDISPTEFSENELKEGEENLVASLLMYKDKPVIGKILKNTDPKEYILSEIFSTYPYNSSIIQILGFNLGFRSDGNDNNGYVPLFGSKITNEDKVRNDKQKIGKSTKLMKTLNDFLSKANQNGVKVFVVVSPTTVNYPDSSIPEIETISKKHNCNFYNFSHVQTFKDFSLFYDMTHLNNKGAEIFTGKLINILKSEKHSNELNIAVQKNSSTIQSSVTAN